MDDLIKTEEVSKFEKTSPLFKKVFFGILSIIILVATPVAFGFTYLTGGISPIFFIILGVTIIFFIYCIKNRSKVGDVALFFSSIVPIVTLILVFVRLIHFL
jgi:hypothetical protein